MITQSLSGKKFSILLVCLVLATPHLAAATDTTCEPELTAVFLVTGIYPGTTLNLDVLFIRELGPITNPTPEQQLAIVQQVYADDPFGPFYYHQPVSQVGNFQLFLAPAGDFGAVTIVDVRDGAVVLAAQTIWMGFGDTLHPSGSSHPWTFSFGAPAVAPASVDFLPNGDWGDGYFGDQEYLTQVSLDFIRQTDVMRSFGSCAPYGVVGYIHTPSLGVTDPLVAFHVLIVSGHAGPPWGPEPIDTTPTSWDMVKSVYR